MIDANGGAVLNLDIRAHGKCKHMAVFVFISVLTQGCKHGTAHGLWWRRSDCLHFSTYTVPFRSIWLSCVTVNFFFVDLILSQIFRFSGIFRNCKKVRLVSNWLKWYSMRRWSQITSLFPQIRNSWTPLAQCLAIMIGQQWQEVGMGGK